MATIRVASPPFRALGGIPFRIPLKDSSRIPQGFGVEGLGLLRGALDMSVGRCWAFEGSGSTALSSEASGLLLRCICFFCRSWSSSGPLPSKPYTP